MGNTIIITLILIIIILIIVHKIYYLYKSIEEQKIEKRIIEHNEVKLELYKKYESLFQMGEDLIKNPPSREKPNKKTKQVAPVNNLQTEKIKYSLYKHYEDLRSNINLLYPKIIISNLWINEPFHTKFYNFLLVFDQNEFMIRDLNSKTFLINCRNNDLVTKKTESYQVFAAAEILEILLEKTITEILKFGRDTAQNIVIAICILILDKSTHYQSKNITKNTIEVFLKMYLYRNDVERILHLIKENDDKFKFIQIALKEAFNNTDTYPYNTSELEKSLFLELQIFPKYLKSI